jgi:hypothetical protein
MEWLLSIGEFKTLGALSPIPCKGANPLDPLLFVLELSGWVVEILGNWFLFFGGLFFLVKFLGVVVFERGGNDCC